MSYAPMPIVSADAQLRQSSIMHQVYAWMTAGLLVTGAVAAYTANSPSVLSLLFGNPYTASAFDANGRVGIDFGVYGVPETFVIDKQGVIRFKQIGPLTPDLIETRIQPLLRKLNG